MDIPTIPGAVYTISTASSCDVTDKASGQLLGTAEAGSPFTTPAYSDALTLSDSSALYVQIKTFNFALAALGLLGGGQSASSLPAGYLAAEFLESTGLGRMELDAKLPSTARIEMDAKFTQALSTRAFFGTEGRGSLTDTRRFTIMQMSDGTRCDFGLWIKNVSFVMPLNKKIKIIKDGALNYVDGQLIATNTAQTFDGLGCVLFSRTANVSGGGAAGCIYWCNIYNSNELVCELIPSVDQYGKPCMYDKTNKKPYYNLEKEALIVGMTMNQALKLSTLPATGGTLTVSLPTGYDSDEGVMTALETARANGWTLIIQTYEAGTAAATFALRRIWVRKTLDEQGTYIAADGTRWQVAWCVDMRTLDGSTPDAHGYELFRSVEAALDYWKLTPYVDPEAEKLLTEYIENE